MGAGGAGKFASYTLDPPVQRIHDSSFPNHSSSVFELVQPLVTPSFISRFANWTYFMLSVAYLMLPVTSTAIAETVKACNVYDKGTEDEVAYISDDLSLECYSSKYYFYVTCVGRCHRCCRTCRSRPTPPNAPAP